MFTVALLKQSKCPTEEEIIKNREIYSVRGIHIQPNYSGIYATWEMSYQRKWSGEMSRRREVTWGHAPDNQRTLTVFSLWLDGRPAIPAQKGDLEKQELLHWIGRWRFLNYLNFHYCSLMFIKVFAELYKHCISILSSALPSGFQIMDLGVPANSSPQRTNLWYLQPLFWALHSDSSCPRFPCR